MAARGRPQGSPLRRYALGRVPRLSPFRVGADAPRRPLLLLWGNSPSAHIGPPCAGLRIFHMTPFGICFLVLPPAGPSLLPSSRQSRCGLRYKRAAGTFALRCGSDFPRLNNPPLETSMKGKLRFPLLGTSPGPSYCWLSGGGGLLRNAPAAPACMERLALELQGRGFSPPAGDMNPVRRIAAPILPTLTER